MALEVIAVAMEKGLKVPEDVSVIGFDDNPACLFGPVALTTIKQPLFQMAEGAVKYLHTVIAGNGTAKKKPSFFRNLSCANPAVLRRNKIFCVTGKPSRPRGI